MNRFYTLLPLLAGIFWGTAGPFVRVLGGQGWDNLTLLFSRASIAALVLMAGIFVLRRELFRIRIKDVWIFLASGVICTIGLNICYQESISRLTLSLAAVLLGMCPVFVLILAAFIFHEKITRLKLVSMFLAIFGCVLVSGVLEQSSSGHVTAAGILIGILSAVFYSFQSILSRVAGNRGYHPLTTSFYSLTFAAIALIPFTNYTTIADYIAAAPLPHTGFIIAQAVCVGVLPYLFYNGALTKVEAGKASIIASGGEPAAATVFGLIFFHEVPTPLSLTGLIIVIIALALLCRPEKSEKPAD